MQIVINVNGKWVRRIGITAVVALFLGSSYWVYASSVTLPNVFVNGFPADADEVNANFNAVATGINDNDLRIGMIDTRVTTLEALPQLSPGTGILIDASDNINADAAYFDARYVSLTGDTMTGALTVQSTMEANIVVPTPSPTEPVEKSTSSASLVCDG